MNTITFLTRPAAERYRVKWVLGLAAASLFIAGCAKTRSISNVAATTDVECFPRPRHVDSPFDYRGELNEFDVLAVDRDQRVSESDIQRALEQARPVNLKAGSSILVVQSGAVFPDGSMLEELKRHFVVVPFSGVPPRREAWSDPALSYSRALRLAAASAGCDTVVCYWGTLESARRKMETKTISWVPIAGWLVPDESQQMRIRLKVALVDVRTGSWSVRCPEPFEDKSWSTHFTRGSSDMKQVEALKQKAYMACVRELTGKALAGGGLPSHQ